MFRSIAVVALLALSSLAQAPSVIRINKQDSKFSLELSTLTASAEPAAQVFRRTLESDLSRCGWFRIVGAGQGQIVVGGSASGGLAVRLYAQGRADQRTYLNQGYNGDGAKAAQIAHKAADDLIKALTGKDGICSAQIALIGNATGKKELYLCDWDGSNLRALTHDNSISLAPKWSPDGRRLLYTSYLRGAASLFSVDLASGQRGQLIRTGGMVTGGSFSPDGSRIALILSKDGNPELYVASANGSGLNRLTRTTGADEASPCWSPDGSQICYVSGPPGALQLFIISGSGGQPQRLTSFGRQNESPDWGPTGRIAYQSLIGGQYQICIIDPATRGYTQLTSAGPAYEDPAWAPDGRHIYATSVAGYQKKVCLLDTEKDPTITLTTARGDWSQPAVSKRK